MGNFFTKPKLSEFQKEKLLHEFCTFYDLDGDGFVKWTDFQIAKTHICKLNGWEEGSEKERMTVEVFQTIWDSLERVADRDSDGRISTDEWVLLWEELIVKVLKDKKTTPTKDDLPMWCHRYLLHRFHMYDRTGDGKIDQDEFEYVLSHFNVPAWAARKAWLIFTENNQTTVNFERFVDLATDFYFSNDPAALGNFITGKLQFEHAQNH